ncbi:gamma-interferon-responsive lysosomal thiol protein-like isoform X1 [Argentina anserina]|uniref:gamma-interferon-responsive lysosomal thiol protein-like isoform X1 n=1 Tax=Argentina anserina TaxID=57926 RepID=UPI0021767F68|nr:gamma-interferon-responsive lysosomal thiol protein-like isoform X1 [Potentilla anserina]
MASFHLFFACLITCPMFLFTFPCAAANQKVTLSVYYDSLNTSCATFIVKNLARIFEDDLMTILNLRLVPWGEAYANKSNNSTAICQHKPDGCKLNSLEACAIDVMHDVNKHFALIYCIEFLAIEGRHNEWETCFSSLGLPKNTTLDCYNSSNATKLEQNYGNETMHLNPPLQFVPWLVLNNQPIGNDYENFTGYVCKAYKGKIAPMACQSVHLKQKKTTDK